MKSFPWNNLKENQIKGTIWEKIDDLKNVELDIKFLEEEFCAKKTASSTN